jgi:hypothetical protein
MKFVGNPSSGSVCKECNWCSYLARNEGATEEKQRDKWNAADEEASLDVITE